MTTMPKDYRELHEALVAAGFEYLGRTKHLKYRHPDGRSMVLPSTPRGGRGLANYRRAVARAIEAPPGIPYGR